MDDGTSDVLLPRENHQAVANRHGLIGYRDEEPSFADRPAHHCVAVPHLDRLESACVIHGPRATEMTRVAPHLTCMDPSENSVERGMPTFTSKWTASASESRRPVERFA